MRAIVGFCLIFLAIPCPQVLGQDPVVVIRPGEVAGESDRAAARAVRVFNRASTTRFFGSHSIGRNEVFRGDVGVFRGPLTVSGIIEGDLVAIEANVRLRSSAEVHGDILIVGGTIDRSAGAHVGGVTRRYRRSVDVRRIGDELEVMPRRSESMSRERYRYSRSSADASLAFGFGPTYNRVEGLPIHFGPRLTWMNNWYSSMRLEALGIYRTAADPETVIDSSLSRTDVGYTVTGELRFGRSGEFGVGGHLFDVVTPVENWQLHDDEIGLAAFLLHRDYRDYYLSRGWDVFAEIKPVREFTLTGTYAREEHTSVAARDPWTLGRRDEAWRENPVVDDGDFELLRAAAEFDSRQSSSYNGSGWFLRAEWERGISDNVTERVLPVSIRNGLPIDDNYVYDRFFLDLRRYERVGWAGQLSLRGVFAGTIDDSDPLPVQKRLSIGHVMPGFGFRAIACNSALLGSAQEAMCDNVLLFQAEYRADLSFRRRSWHGRRTAGSARGRGGSGGGFWDWDDWDDWLWFDGPSLLVFSDAGTGWLRGNDVGDLEFDIGAGIEFGSVAVYAAKPITKSGAIRMTLRLHRRF